MLGKVSTQLVDFILNQKKMSLLNFYLHTVTWRTPAIMEIIYVHEFQLLGFQNFVVHRKLSQRTESSRGGISSILLSDLFSACYKTVLNK